MVIDPESVRVSPLPVPTRPTFLRRQKAVSAPDHPRTLSDPESEDAVVCYHYISCLYCIHRIQVLSIPSADTRATPANTSDEEDSRSIDNMDYLLENCEKMQDNLKALTWEVKNMQGGLRAWREQCEERRERRRK
jgi:hypothetical protein